MNEVMNIVQIAEKILFFVVRDSPNRFRDFMKIRQVCTDWTDIVDGQVKHYKARIAVTYLLQWHMEYSESIILSFLDVSESETSRNDRIVAPNFFNYLQKKNYLSIKSPLWCSMEPAPQIQNWFKTTGGSRKASELTIIWKRPTHLWRLVIWTRKNAVIWWRPGLIDQKNQSCTSSFGMLLLSTRSIIWWNASRLHREKFDRRIVFFDLNWAL